MNRNEIQDLIRRYNSGKCSDDEKELVESWYLQYEDPDIKDLSDQERSSDLVTIWQTLPVNQSSKKSIRKIYRFAAAAALFIFLGVGFYYKTHHSSNQSAIIQTLSKKLVPGSNKALLTLSNGSQIVLSEVKKGNFAEQNNVAISKNAKNTLFYKMNVKSQRGKELVYNSVSTPMGATYDLVLSDGTKVSLDAASSIRFPVVFSTKERKVEVTGQAYFEVAHDKSKPFIVSSRRQTVEVIGTHFNVNSYSDEGAVKTTLLEGRVKVYNGQQNIVLRPGQQSIFADDTKLIEVKNVDTEADVAWKYGMFRFKRADLQVVMRQFARWYNVKVIYEGPVPDAAITGKIPRNSSAEEILKILNNLGVRFRIDGEKLIILKN